MDFVIDNYLWFIIGGIVLIMIIIGYFAEKTNFGKKPLTKNKAEEQIMETEVSEKKEEPTITEVQNEKIADVLDTPVEEDLTVPMDSEFLNVDIPEETESLSEFELPEEDLNVPFGDDQKQSDSQKNEISDVAEVVENSEPDEDDVWKF